MREDAADYRQMPCTGQRGGARRQRLHGYGHVCPAPRSQEVMLGQTIFESTYSHQSSENSFRMILEHPYCSRALVSALPQHAYCHSHPPSHPHSFPSRTHRLDDLLTRVNRIGTELKLCYKTHRTAERAQAAGGRPSGRRTPTKQRRSSLAMYGRSVACNRTCSAA